MRWSEAQQAAIDARGCNLLVSAAAGSGKTAVLAARIVALIKEGVRMDDLLVVTFTKAAAAEMRARILTALQDEAEAGYEALAIQALRVERADISTLHGFCTRVCRNHFQAAGVDPTFRVADTAQANVLRDQAMLEALTACYEDPSAAFAHTAACLEQERLIESVDNLHRFLMARPDPWQWLETALDAHDTSPEALKDSQWMGTLLQRIHLDAAAAVDAYRRLVAFAEEAGLFEAFSRQEREMAEAFFRAAETGYDALMAFGDVKFASRPRKNKEMDAEAVETFALLRDEAKLALSAAAKRRDGLADLERRAEDLRACGVQLRGIAEATRAFHLRYAGLKEEKNLLDFHDLEHFTLQALTDSDVADALRGKYRYIFIDEYQDASLIQEALLDHIRRGDNLFMVGDVKQSIYRFRLAEPTLFLQKLAAFSPEAGAVDRRIALNANYRSHSRLLEGINAVFDRVFCGGVMELPYDSDARLMPGLESEWDGAPVELHLMLDSETDTDDEEELSPQARDAVEREAEKIADRIEELLRAPEGGYRLRDMAVLMRTVRSKAAQMVEVLRMRGIPAWSDLGEDTLERGEVRAMVNLLQTIDNFRQDIPLLASLRGPALGLSDEALAAIRIAYPEGSFAGAVLSYAQGEGDLSASLRGFIEKIREWAFDARVLTLDALLRHLYVETGHYALSGALPDGSLRQANLRLLAEHAGAYQRSQQGGLGGFLRYIERIHSGEGMAAQEIGETDDLVRVLSIHKSKGLQFPVVFVAGLGSKFRTKDTQQPVQLHAELGMGMERIDPALRTRYPTVAQEAILEKLRQERVAEEARILYVAMTRAQQRLILLGTGKKGAEERWQRPQTDAGVASATGYLDWLAPVALHGAEFSVFRHDRKSVLQEAQANDAKEKLLEALRTLPPPLPEGNVARALSWVPPILSGRPLKQSVTAQVKAGQKDGEDEDALSAFASLPKRPLFMESRGLTGAERGDAIHAFFRVVPLAETDVYAARQRMAESGQISEAQAEALPMEKLARCIAGPLWKRMRASGEVHREWAFNLLCKEEGEGTLLQGVIDCCFLEDNDWVLVDYKTDRTQDIPALLSRYQPQLSLYAKALQEITGRAVKERIVFLVEQEAGYPV